MEPLLTCDQNDKLSLFPVKRPHIYKLFTQAVECFWGPGEVDAGADRTDYESMNEGQQKFVRHVLGFFAVGDSLVIQNCLENFCSEVQDNSARLFFAFQAGIEAIHSVVYNELIQTIIADPTEREQLFKANLTLPCVAEKTEWVAKHMDKRLPFARRLIVFLCLEGIFFQGSFACVFYIRKLNKMNGFTFANEMIAKDEGLHATHLVALYKELNNPLDRGQLIGIIDEAVDIETRFITEAIPCRLLGINSDMMSQYIRYVADFWLAELGEPKFYKCDNPFGFMESISMQAKSNFFEKRVAEYSTPICKGEFDIASDF